jgi:DNA-binding MarR family transcriptional regulator
MAGGRGSNVVGAPVAPAPSLLYAVKQVELAVRYRLDELLRASGVTTVQYTALTVLRRRDGLSSAELARNSFVTAQSMADVVTALERRALIERHRDARNRRRLVIRLTPAGQDLLASLDAPVRRLEDRMVSGLYGDEVGGLRKALNSCRIALSDGAPR